MTIGRSLRREAGGGMFIRINPPVDSGESILEVGLKTVKEPNCLRAIGTYNDMDVRDRISGKVHVFYCDPQRELPQLL